jgi:high-affinity iron transporter
MSGSSISTDALRGGAAGDSDPSGSSRGRRLALWLAGIGVLVVVALVAAATIPGSHSAPKPFSTLAVAPQGSPANQLHTRETSVFDSNIPARDYGTRISRLENGIGADGQIASDLDPIPARAFNRPVAGYIHYALGVSGQLGAAVAALTAQLQAGDRATAERAWDVAFTDYLHLGAVYGLLPGNLNDHLAQVPSSLTQTHFTGLHRVEKGLWQGAPLRSLVPISAAIGGAVVSLKQTLPRTEIDPLDYAARAHEILEDAQRDLMSGSQVPWSGEGVLGTAAGVTATREVVRTLAPLMQGRDNTLVQVDNWLLRLQSVMDSIRRRDGSYPTVTQLSIAQRERINGNLAGALTALQGIPPTLETAAAPSFPTIAGQEHAK